MKELRRFAVLGSVLAGALLCAGCFNLLEPPVRPRSEDVTVTFTIDGAGDMARSVLPRMGQFDRIELSARVQGGGETLGPVPVTEGSADLVLGGGSWDITANAYIAPDSATPAAAAVSVITNAGGLVEGETRLSLLPVGTGPGILRYVVDLPQDLSLKPGGSRIRAELQGELKDSQVIDESSSSGELSLEPGIYAADITLTNAAGKTAVYREAVSILSGLVTEIGFSPAAAEFLDPGARAMLTSLVLFKAINTPQTGFTGGGSDVNRTLNIALPRDEDTIYFSVQKNPVQTLTVTGPGADRVSRPGTAPDGASASNILTIFAVSIPDLAENGGELKFTVTAGESGKTPIDTAVTVTVPRIHSITAWFHRFETEPGNYSMRLTYQVGDSFDYDSVIVTSLNYDTSKVVETVYNLEGFDTATPGIKTVRISKGGVYARIDAYQSGAASVDMMVVEKSNAKLVFDYGSQDTSTVPAPVPPGGYTTPRGRPLVLAPVKWNVPDGAVYQWKVDGTTQSPTHPANTEYFTFNPAVEGEYTLTVTATLEGGQTVSAVTKVTCCPPEGTYLNTAKSMGPYFTGGAAPTQFNSDGRNGGSGFGGLAGDKFFATSIPNSGSYDLRITGNAFGSWIEPGIVWVAQDANGNGIMDDTWYELKGAGAEVGVQIVRRYAVTFHANGSWQDNLGQAGTVPGGASWYPWQPNRYPNGIVPDWITLTGTCIVHYSGAATVTGYVDTMTSLFKISDAIQADGTPVHLDYIDFVSVKTGMHRYTQLFGEVSTEVMSLNRYNPYDPERKLTGVSNGEGAYTYRLVNNSGYTLTVPVAILNGVFTEHILGSDANETFTLSENAAYFDYSGGNVTVSISGNTVTFGPGTGGY